MDANADSHGPFTLTSSNGPWIKRERVLSWVEQYIAASPAPFDPTMIPRLRRSLNLSEPQIHADLKYCVPSNVGPLTPWRTVKVDADVAEIYVPASPVEVTSRDSPTLEYVARPFIFMRDALTSRQCDHQTWVDFILLNHQTNAFIRSYIDPPITVHRQK